MNDELLTAALSAATNNPPCTAPQRTTHRRRKLLRYFRSILTQLAIQSAILSAVPDLNTDDVRTVYKAISEPQLILRSGEPGCVSSLGRRAFEPSGERLGHPATERFHDQDTTERIRRSGKRTRCSGMGRTGTPTGASGCPVR